MTTGRLFLIGPILSHNFYMPSCCDDSRPSFSFWHADVARALFMFRAAVHVL